MFFFDKIGILKFSANKFEIWHSIFYFILFFNRRSLFDLSNYFSRKLASSRKRISSCFHVSDPLFSNWEIQSRSHHKSIMNSCHNWQELLLSQQIIDKRSAAFGNASFLFTTANDRVPKSCCIVQFFMNAWAQCKWFFFIFLSKKKIKFFSFSQLIPIW